MQAFLLVIAPNTPLLSKIWWWKIGLLWTYNWYQLWPIVHSRDSVQVGQHLESITEVHHLLLLPWKGSSHLLNCTHLARSQGHVSHFLMVSEESFFDHKGEGEMVKGGNLLVIWVLAVIWLSLVLEYFISGEGGKLRRPDLVGTHMDSERTRILYKIEVSNVILYRDIAHLEVSGYPYMENYFP